MSAGTMAEAAAIVGGHLSGGNRPWNGVSTDSRKLAAGQLFVALQGPNFDGNEFLPQVADQGAAGAIVSRPDDTLLPQVQVADTRIALGRLAAAWRNHFSPTMIGITGSNGKTTVKELLAACLGPSALATRGNLNNEIGLPLMLLQLTPDHEFGVFEMGCSRPGDIAWLAALARPDIGVVTNAGPAHLEGLGSVEGVARTKGELFSALGGTETAVVNADDRFRELWETMAGPARVVTFGVKTEADVCAVDIVPRAEGSRFRLVTAAGDAMIELALPGEHNVANACCAAAVALEAGTELESVAARLATCRGVGGRLAVKLTPTGATIYDDSYNANPDSLQAAARFLTAQDTPAWLVVGDMLELGREEAKIHERAGADLRAAGVERLYCIGELSRHLASGFGSGASWFESVEALTTALRADLKPSVNLLVKGSRGMRMERVVHALLRPEEGR